MPQQIFQLNRTIQCSASRSVKYDTIMIFFYNNLILYPNINESCYTENIQ